MPAHSFFFSRRRTPLRAVSSAISGSANTAEVITTAGRRRSLLRSRWTWGRRQSLLRSRRTGGRTTKATDESGRPRRQLRHHRWLPWLCLPLETTINKQRGDEMGDGDEMCEEGGGTHNNRGERTRRHNNQIKMTTAMMTR